MPTACGDLSNNCVREFEADQVHNFMFTAVNCGSQQSTASTLTVDARGNAALYNIYLYQFTYYCSGVSLTEEVGYAFISEQVMCHFLCFIIFHILRIPEFHLLAKKAEM